MKSVLCKFITVICFTCVYSQASTSSSSTHESCTLPSGSPGHCVPIQSCTYLANLFEPAPKPLSADQVDTLHSHHCGFHGTSPTPKVCCPHPPAAAAHQQVHQEVPQALGNRRGSKRGLINQQNCGGRVASMAKYPWMALLAYNTSSGVIFKCGGTLINSNYILTAAQCLTPQLIAVRLGEYDTSTDIDCIPQKGCLPPVQDVSVSELVRHGDFNPTTMQHDIGLVRLSRPANVDSDTIKPICLPLQDEYPNLVGQYGDITGWGVTETGLASDKLLKVRLPLVSLASCQLRYTERGTGVVLAGGQLCAGGLQGKDACSGDGGGPLALQAADGAYVQHGIVSFGSRFCGTQGQGLPGVYTNVGRYFQWILDNIRE